jgi:hypothetical protein
MKKKIAAGFVFLCATVSVSLPASAWFHPFVAFVPQQDVAREIRSHDNQMLEAVRIAEANAHKRSRRRCWRAVKNAMLEANVLEERPTTRYAKHAGEELESKFGFKKIDVTDPFDAPVGAVLVYGGRGAGHVEFRTADGFVSDHVSDHPSRRPLIGVYVRI